MVVIRLSRTGTNKRPFYHVVVADKRFSRDGRYLERVGFYNPIASGPDIYLRLENERIQYWVSKGAQPTERVNTLIKDFAKTGEITGSQYAEGAKAAKKAKLKAAKKAKAASKQAEAAETTETTAQ